MKMNALYAAAVLIGAALGYYLGNLGGVSGWELFYEIFFGVLLGFNIMVFTFEQKDYGSWLGAIVSLMVVLALDWAAGSPVDVRNKLSFTVAGLFTGWAFWVYWKQVLIGGFIGGIGGFVWGFMDSHWFGQVCLQPGILNASLLAVQMFMLGMLCGSLYMKLYGWQFLKPRSQA